MSRGRRRTSHATAAERAADYVKRVRERVVARRLREQAAAKEGDDEEEETEVEVEDPDADHKPLGKRGPEDPPDGEGGLEGRVGTAFSLEGGAAPNFPPQADHGGHPGQRRVTQCDAA